MIEFLLTAGACELFFFVAVAGLVVLYEPPSYLTYSGASLGSLAEVCRAISVLGPFNFTNLFCGEVRIP